MQNNFGQNNFGVILMTYGSATTAEQVGAYLGHIYKGAIPVGLVAEFESRYRLIGESPLVTITKRQAALLEQRLHCPVRAGMLHSAPFIEDAVMDLKKNGVKRVVGIILSPQFSSFIMDGYRMALMRAAENQGFSREAVFVADPWPTEPHFIKLLANRVRTSLVELEKKYGTKIPVLFTTHSLPKRVVDKDPKYLDELQATIDAVLAELNMLDLAWYACYQSAGHTPEAWLKPDLTDILDQLVAHKTATAKMPPAVLIAPIQFLADHLEILYDLDIAAQKQCEERGIEYNRIALPNGDGLFIEALVKISELHIHSPLLS